MSLAVTEEHEELAQTVRAFLARHDERAAARVALDGGAALPAFWGAMAQLGWLGLHLPEEAGGSGYGLFETAVVAHELGRACVPGPFLPTVVTSAVLAALGSADQRAAWLAGLADGSATAGLGLAGSLERRGGGLHGAAGPVLCAAGAAVLALAAGDDLVLVAPDGAGVRLAARPNLDPGRPCADVQVDGAPAGTDRLVPGGAVLARRLLQVLAAAEASGAAHACSELATEYAKGRHAFGRPIGQFQAVKHHCANIRIEAELATAAAWDAARAAEHDPGSPAVDTGVALALPASLRCAKLLIQVHGGIGYTWEHDAHLFLRRAGALVALAGPVAAAEAAVTLADTGSVERTIELPPEAEPLRREARAFAARYRAVPDDQRRQFLCDTGYLFAHWPAPYGRGAGVLEQLVIEQELGQLPPDAMLGRTGWTVPIVLPTVMAHGTPDQKERWIRPTMEGGLTWCQLFSEPDAGSDLAALATRAERVDGGWRLTGQKVWTSTAHLASRGLALVRTNRDAPKHRGITCMVVDMAAPGVTIRPLRQITGESEFNEVFLDEVFVPDGDVLGDVDRGWDVARTTLGNERVSLGAGSWGAGPHWDVLRDVARRSGDPRHLAAVGHHLAVLRGVRALGLRAAARAVAGGPPGIEGNIAKLLLAENAQRAGELGVAMLGATAVYGPADPESGGAGEGDEAVLTQFFLRGPMLTIAGGTSEIVRNVVAERILGLPRD